MIVVAGVVACVAVGAAALGYDDYSDDSDHEYGDAAVRERRRRAAQRRADERRKEAARAEARQELDSLVEKSVRSFEVHHGVSVDVRVRSGDCAFRSFTEDMRPMTDSAQAAIKAQVGTDVQQRVNEEKERIKQIDRVIRQINEHILARG